MGSKTRVFVRILQVRSLRAEVKGEKENSRGARGGGDPWKLVKILVSQQFILVLDYFVFRIELDTLLHYTFSVQTRDFTAAHHRSPKLFHIH